MKIINFKKKKMKLLKKEQQESYENAKKFYICKEDKKYCKVRDQCHYAGEYRGVTHRTFNLKYKKISVAFHNESNYYYHFIIKVNRRI